ncbi:MAG: trypsin-like serine protease [Myxococcota bacterium]
MRPLISALSAFALIGAGVAFANPPALGDLIPASDDSDETEVAIDAPVQDDVTAQIVNGEEVSGQDFSEVVYLSMNGSSGGSSCTGSLIHPNWVLTAAHCIDSVGTAYPAGSPYVPGYEPAGDQIIVSFGNSVGNFTRSVVADRWYIHPDWVIDEATDVDNGVGSFEGDVALVHLAESVDDQIVMALNSEPMDDSYLDSKITFIGFGKTRWDPNGSPGSGTKRFVDVPIIRTAGPQGDDPYLVQTRDSETGKSTCQGDSGGPGVIGDIEGGAYVQVSVTSHGVQCGEGVGGHMRVDHYRPWICDAILGGQDGDVCQTAPAGIPNIVCNREINPEDPETQAVGEVPFDLTCRVSHPDPRQLTNVTWTWGDGTEDTVGLGGTTPAEDDVVVHTYTEGGIYSMRVCFDGSYPDSGAEWKKCVERQRYVRACAIPDVEFRIEPVEDYVYRLRNLTELDEFECLTDVQWDIFAGSDTSGTPVRSLSTWEPEFDFAEKGEYTVVLNVTSFAGTGAAGATFEAVRIAENARCSHVGGAGAGMFGLGFLFLGLRRRRNS